MGNHLLRSLIFVVTCTFIYQQVFQKISLPGLLETLEGYLSKPGVPVQMMILLLLMGVNWCLESYKWQILISKVEKVSFFLALQAVLAGISISSFTPNRTGEFIGRVFILKKANPVEGILVTLVGSMSQLLVTLMAGSTALLFFIPRYMPELVAGHRYVYHAVILLLVTVNLILLGFYFNLSFLSGFRGKLFNGRFQKLRRLFRVFALYRKQELARIIILSMVRFAVFSSQFFLLLKIFKVNVPYPDALVLICLIYLSMTIIPTFALSELGIRGSVALYFFGLYFSHHDILEGAVKLGVFSASTLLWIINIGIPAMFGAFFIFRLRFFRTMS